MYIQAMALNPQAILSGIKTDVLAYRDVSHMVPTHREIWGEVNIEAVPKVNHRTIVVQGHNICTGTYTARVEDWHNFSPDRFDVVLKTENQHVVRPDLPSPY